MGRSRTRHCLAGFVGLARRPPTRRGPVTNTRERFDAKWMPEPNTGCWLWTGRLNSKGYGRIRVDGHQKRAHRVSWEMHRHPIPDGLVIDHTCRVRSCVNPDHLRVVTPRVNAIENSGSVSARYLARATCSHGHVFDEKNTRHATVITKTGRTVHARRCRQCEARTQRAYQRRRQSNA